VKVADSASDNMAPSPPDGGVPKPASVEADVWVRSVVDGKVMLSQAVNSGGPYKGSLQINKDGRVDMSLGPLVHSPLTPVDTSIGTALILVYGRGTSARLSNLVVTTPDTAKRCRAPGTWLRHLMRGEPVVGKNANLADASNPSVIREPKGNGYLMALVGKGSRDTLGGIFIATSKAGREFTLEHKGQVKPVMEEGSAQFGHLLASPALFHDGVDYRMWYSTVEAKGGGRRGIALATSKDGRVWTRYKGAKGDVVFVLPPDKDDKKWDSGSVKDPTIWKDTKTYLHMWYTGDVWYPGVFNTVPSPAIGFAVSKDGGATWERKGKVDLSAGTSSKGVSTTAVEAPMVLYDGAAQQFLMWFTRRAFGATPSIQHAVSPDGAKWHPWPGAALGHGPPGTFDERGVQNPTVLLEGTRTRMWFGGLNSKGVGQIGYAENRGGR